MRKQCVLYAVVEEPDIEVTVTSGLKDTKWCNALVRIESKMSIAMLML